MEIAKLDSSKRLSNEELAVTVAKNNKLIVPISRTALNDKLSVIQELVQLYSDICYLRGKQPNQVIAVEFANTVLSDYYFLTIKEIKTALRNAANKESTKFNPDILVPLLIEWLDNYNQLREAEIIKNIPHLD